MCMILQQYHKPPYQKLKQKEYYFHLQFDIEGFIVRYYQCLYHKPYSVYVTMPQSDKSML